MLWEETTLLGASFCKEFRGKPRRPLATSLCSVNMGRVTECVPADKWYLQDPQGLEIWEGRVFERPQMGPER